MNLRSILNYKFIIDAVRIINGSCFHIFFVQPLDLNLMVGRNRVLMQLESLDYQDQIQYSVLFVSDTRVLLHLRILEYEVDNSFLNNFSLNTFHEQSSLLIIER